MSGEEASFLVGGEFPIQTTDSNGVTSVSYKPYGVQLKFTPVLRSNGQVALSVDTGVSEVQSGTYSLTRRDVKTSVELSPGSTLAIGGLLDERMSRSMNQVPGLGDIPILGACSARRHYQTQQTEMVVLVTPYIVNPSRPIPSPCHRLRHPLQRCRGHVPRRHGEALRRRRGRRRDAGQFSAAVSASFSTDPGKALARSSRR